MGDMGQRSIRFPDGLEAKVLAHAEAVDRSFSYLAVKAVEAAAKDWDEVVEAVNAGAEVRVVAGSSRAPVEKEPSPQEAVGAAAGLELEGAFRAWESPSVPAPSRPPFKCRDPKCDFRASSPKAVCGMHGRTVVPV